MKKELNIMHLNQLSAIAANLKINETELYYLDMLYCAIENIKDYYIKSKTPYSNGEEEENVELGIASELNRQHQNRMENNDNPLKLLVGPEVTKHISTSEIEILSNYYIRPDFVVHHNNESFDCQLIAGEIKRQKALYIDNVAIDINKLLLYHNPAIWGGHNYSYPVFIVFSSDFEMFQNTMNNFLKNDRKLDFRCIDSSIVQMTLKDYLVKNIDDIKKIICFFYLKENDVSVSTLYEVISPIIVKTTI